MWPAGNRGHKIRIVLAALIVLASKGVQLSMGFLYGAAIDKMVPGLAEWRAGPLRRNRALYVKVGVAAAMINFFSLIVALFTMTVYDRIVPNNATESLIGLTIGLAVMAQHKGLVDRQEVGFDVERIGLQGAGQQQCQEQKEGTHVFALAVR